MTGTEVHDAITTAIEPLRADIRDVRKVLDGVGSGNGLKGRIVRMETILWLIGALAISSVGMSSCAIRQGVIKVPVAEAAK